MDFRKNVKSLVAASALMLISAGAMQAATVDFDGLPNGVSTPLLTDGFNFDEARIVSGNCAAGDCLALKPNASSTLTLVGGGAFDLGSLWFQLLGETAALMVTGFDELGGILATQTFESPPLDNNVGYAIDFAGLFDNFFSVSFTNIGKGNVRIDNINTSAVAAVPLPAAGALLMAAMAGLGMFGRRKNKLT